MTVRLSLEQSIFTSRQSFETVARSSGLGADERRELETRAAYPRNWIASAPLIFRAFPLLSTPGDFAVVRARYVDADASGRLHNFLVHSYVVRKADVDRVDGNLAWLSTYLGCARNCPAGTTLSREELVCDPSRAFRFLRLVVPDLSKERTARVLTHLLSHLGQTRAAKPEDDSPLVLSLGPAAADEQLRHWLTLVQLAGEEPLPIPAPDVLNAWRLASLLAVLPRPFRDIASFSINEVSVVPGFALVVQQDGPPTTLPPVPVHPFVERCLAWIENDRLEEVEALVTWMGCVMVAPSTEALADLTAFYEDVIIPLRDGACLDWLKVGQRWRALSTHSPLQCEPVMVAAKSCLAVAPVQHQDAIVLAATQIMAASGGYVDDAIVTAASSVLGSELPFETRHALQSQLPQIVQQRLWRLTQDRRGRSMVSRENAHAISEESLWLLAALAARVYGQHTLETGESPPAWFFQALEDGARRRASSDFDAMVEYLASLARAPIAFGDFRRRLVDHLHRRLSLWASLRPAAHLAGTHVRPDLRRCETHVVAALLDRCVSEPTFSRLQVERALDIVIDFVRACSGGGFGDGRLMAEVLLAWLPKSVMNRTAQCVDRLAAAMRIESAGLVGAAYRELLMIRRDPVSAFLVVPPLAHRRWLEHRRRLARQPEPGSWRANLRWGARTRELEAFVETSVACFYRNVRLAVVEPDPAVGLALGLEYAEHEPGELSKTLIELVQTGREPLSGAWQRGEVRFAGQRVSMADLLARLLLCADADGRLPAAARAVAEVPRYQLGIKREELADALLRRRVSLERIERAAGLRWTGREWMGGRS